MKIFIRFMDEQVDRQIEGNCVMIHEGSEYPVYSELYKENERYLELIVHVDDCIFRRVLDVEVM